MSRPRSAVRNRLEHGAYRMTRGLAGLAGPRILATVGTAVGEVFHRVAGRRRRILEHNLAVAFPELSGSQRAALGRRVARHFGRVLLDALRIQRLGPQALEAEVEVEGESRLRAAADAGGGLFVLSAHLGSWEVAALVTGLRLEHGLAVINRPLDNPLLEAELADLRARFGNRALGKRQVAREVLRQIRAGGAVGILIDQRVRPEVGIEVPFFGRPTVTHPVLARLARRSGAPVVPVIATWEGPARYRVWYGEPITTAGLPPEELDDVALTTRFSALVEDLIRARPEQWLWYHDRWRQRAR